MLACQRFFYFLFALLLPLPGLLAQTSVSGMVIDSQSQAPLPYANVVFLGTAIGTTSDSLGRFSLHSSRTADSLGVSYAGYKTARLTIKPGKTQGLKIALAPISGQLTELEVAARRKVRYRNKDNPAVELIRKVIENKESNRASGIAFYTADKYEKTDLAFSRLSEKFKSKREFRSFRFVFDNVDTTKLPGLPVVPFYVKETLSRYTWQQNPPYTREEIYGEKKVELEGYIDEAGSANFLNNLYQQVDIYDNNLILLTNPFISPVALYGPTVYRYFISDTLEISGDMFARLHFEPRNTTDLLFNGQLLVALDGSYALKSATLTIDSHANLNLVNALQIDQQFEKQPTGKYLLVRDEFVCDFVLQNKFTGIVGHRVTSLAGISLQSPAGRPFLSGKEIIRAPALAAKADSFWVQQRHEPLTLQEQQVYRNIDSLQHHPGFNRFAKLIAMSISLHYNTGPFEIGPFNSLYSFNPIEGHRFRLGGRTTPKFSKRFSMDGYTAYGLKDERFKYRVGAIYSLTQRGFNEFPLRAVRLGYRYDLRVPGMEHQLIEQDNFLLSFRRGPETMWLLSRIFTADYINEFANNFSFVVGFRNWEQSPLGSLAFRQTNADGSYTPVTSLATTELSLLLRWAPNEKYYQGRYTRFAINLNNPVFTLRLLHGTTGSISQNNRYSQAVFNVRKRTFLSQLGYSEVSLEGGKIFGSVPFPLLFIHAANQTYVYDPGSFNLMNFLEFISDQYASAYWDHHFNGFFLNKLPVVKRLKLREIVGVKALYGTISRTNNPALTQGLFLLPYDEVNGQPYSYRLGRMPYLEGSVGLGNIFKLLRVDLVKRFTYLDHPHISKLGVRASLSVML